MIDINKLNEFQRKLFDSFTVEQKRLYTTDYVVDHWIELKNKKWPSRCGLCGKPVQLCYGDTRQSNFYQCENPDCRAVGLPDKYKDIVFRVQNVRSCPICQGRVDRFPYHFQCMNPLCGAHGDLVVGIFDPPYPDNKVIIIIE